MVKVYYNGIDVFSGIAPTPFVGLGDSMVNYRDRFGAIQSITLDGNITGQCETFAAFVSKQDQILSSFSSDFKTLEVHEDGVPVFTAPYIKVESVDFSQSSYIGLVPFSIQLTSMPSGMFTGIYGVTEPKNNTSYTEAEDGTVSVSRSFSAKGFNTNAASNSLANATNYVQSLTGQAFIAPQLITGNTSVLVPRSISENIDRLSSTYGVDIEYIYRKGAPSSTLLSYNLSVSYDENVGVYSASIGGSIKGGMGLTMADLRTDFNSFKPNIFNLVLTKFMQMTDGVYLNPSTDNFSIDESASENSISFQYSYSSDPFTVKFNPKFTLAYDYPADIYNLSVAGSLTTKGPQTLRMAILETELSNINLPSLAQDFYTSNTSSTAPLNTLFKSYNIDRDYTAPSINVSTSYDNSPVPPDGFMAFKYTISFVPSTSKYAAIQFLDGGNGAFDMNLAQRGSISIAGTATLATNSNGSSTVRDQALQVLNINATQFGASERVRTTDNIKRDLYSTQDGYTYSFTITDTCDTTIFTL